MTTSKKFSIENVVSFRGFDVIDGEISIHDSEWSEYLTDAYGYVNVCGNEYASGDILEAQDPVAFRCGKADYESEIQSELEEQLANEDEDGIEFENDFDEEDESEEA
ncbi:hypothetical protein D3C85_1391980 [compost metagenome]